MDPELDMGTVIDEARGARCSRRASTRRSPQGAKLLHGNEPRRRALFADGARPRAARDDAGARGDLRPGRRRSSASRDIDEAIRISNGTAYGLSSAVCTNRLDYITRFVAELDVGTVNVREVPGYRLELTPFGGIKDSGLGYKEGVQEAMKSFTNVKTYSLPWN